MPGNRIYAARASVYACVCMHECRWMYSRDIEACARTTPGSTYLFIHVGERTRAPILVWHRQSTYRLYPASNLPAATQYGTRVVRCHLRRVDTAIRPYVKNDRRNRARRLLSERRFDHFRRDQSTRYTSEEQRGYV